MFNQPEDSACLQTMESTGKLTTTMLRSTKSFGALSSTAPLVTHKSLLTMEFSKFRYSYPPIFPGLQGPKIIVFVYLFCDIAEPVLVQIKAQLLSLSPDVKFHKEGV